MDTEKPDCGGKPKSKDELKIQGFKRVFIVIDALDEYSEDNRQDFLEMMACLQRLGANIIITSRDHISDHVNGSGLVNIQRIDIRATTEDITMYVQTYMEKQTHMARILRKEPSLRQEIVNTVVQSCQGMFLLAKLQIQSLRKHISAGSLRDALGVLPETIHDIYNQVMDRIKEKDNDHAENALRVLSYLVHAQRPLKLNELLHFLAIQPGDTYLNDKYFADPDTLVAICAGLVVCDEVTGIIGLVHFTTQDT
ncbi:hypothetical protein C8R43DRAFT_1139716 [Mycena crocata]|nr:hypothetical protein C8R43DRAFT_1139716 [Mycena crocata]